MHLPRSVGRLALVLLASAFPAPTATAQLVRRDLGPAPEVRKVELSGVSKQVDIRQLEASIYTEATACKSAFLTPICKWTRWRPFQERHFFDKQEFQRDVLRIRVFYYKHGFRDTQVDTAVTRVDENAVNVRFDIHEGKPTVVASVTARYDSTLISTKTAGSLTLLKTGTPLDLFVLDSMRAAFQNEMWEHGYADALIDTSTVVDTATRTAQVQVHVQKNHLTVIGNVEIQGTQQVAEATVRNALSFGPGDSYRRSAVIESQRNLYESSLFKLVTFNVPTTFDSVKTVNIVLREAPLHEARIGGGFNTVDYLETDGRYAHNNLFGGARRLEVTGTLGNLGAGSLNGRGIFHSIALDSTITGDGTAFLQPTWQGAINLTQPSFLQGSRNSLNVGVFAQRRAIPAVVIDRGEGGNLTFTRELALRTSLSVLYRYEVTRVEAGGPYFCVDFGVCDTTSIGALRSHQRLSPIQAQFQIDRSDQPLTPSTGYIARVQLEHAASYTASDYQYERASAEATNYLRLGSKTSVLAAHLRMGFVRATGGDPNLATNSVLHPRTRFYAGGSQSVRGFGENQLGPRVLTLPAIYLLHARTAAGAPCFSTTAAIRLCDPNTAQGDTSTSGFPAAGGFPAAARDSSLADDGKFTPRAVGGTSLLEGSVEYRFRLPFFENLGAAVFIDGAAVGENPLNPAAGVSTLGNLVRGTTAITPGFGVRYYSPVGPIRVDAGFNPSRSEDLTVVTNYVNNGKAEIIPLDIPRHFSPTGSSTGIRSVLNRFTLHLSIGEAY